MAAWIPDELRGEAAARECRCLLDLAERWQQQMPDEFRILHSGDMPRRDFAGCQVMLAVEGGGAVGDAPELWERLGRSGVKAVSLTWNGDNAWASGCGGTPDAGLTAVGRRAVKQLEALGVTVDVAHLNAAGFWETAALCRKPFIATHTNAAAVYPHPRNLTDEQFGVIRDRGGLVGLDLYPGHLGEWSPEQFQRHVEHFLALDGENTVCIGSDLDGFSLPDGTDGPALLAGLRRHLQKAGYPESLLNNIFYQNARRFFFGQE